MHSLCVAWFEGITLAKSPNISDSQVVETRCVIGLKDWTMRAMNTEYLRLRALEVQIYSIFGPWEEYSPPSPCGAILFPWGRVGGHVLPMGSDGGPFSSHGVLNVQTHNV